MNARCATLNVSASSANGRRWRWMLSFVRPVAILAALAFASLPALAESRFALVIGNGAYRAVPELVNPPNDARDVAEALKSLGFKVTFGVDLDQAEMQQAIAAFASSAAGADASLFYFAGHGLQFAGRNYLIPVDAQLHSVADIEKRTIPLDDVLGALKKDTGIHLVFLDACRSNPFAGAGVTLPESGLARVGKLPGFFTAFATQPDNVAFDGAGRNSPFARALLGHVATPGFDISSMMIAVRNDVFASDRRCSRSLPTKSLLTRQFYFAGNAATEESPETQLWRLAGGERDPNLLTAYLDRYPDGPHAADVRSLLARGGKAAKTPSPAQGDVEELLWSLARSGRQARLAELYLARYPDGAHVEDAKAADRQPARRRGDLVVAGVDLRASGHASARRHRERDTASRWPICRRTPRRRSKSAGRRRRASRNGALHRAARARDRRGGDVRRSLRALQEGRGRKRRARDGQSRPDARNRRPCAQGSQGGIRSLREGGRAAAAPTARSISPSR